jgi:hypothetical protein
MDRYYYINELEMELLAEIRNTAMPPWDGCFEQAMVLQRVLVEPRNLHSAGGRANIE